MNELSILIKLMQNVIIAWLTNSMAYATRRFNVSFTKTLQCQPNSMYFFFEKPTSSPPGYLGHSAHTPGPFSMFLCSNFTLKWLMIFHLCLRTSKREASSRLASPGPQWTVAARYYDIVIIILYTIVIMIVKISSFIKYSSIQIQEKNSNLDRDLNLGPPDLQPVAPPPEPSWFNWQYSAGLEIWRSEV